MVPTGNAFPDAQDKAGFDVFYIHPTTFRNNVDWVQDIADKSVNDWTDASVVARQAAIFNACCRVFAPRYRQATFGSTGPSPNGPKAYAFALEDVKRAFAYYIEHENKGRPFILVGHSQGTFHLAPLLEQMVDQTELKDRFVAAYAIGIGIPMGSFGRQFKNVVACTKPDQTGCLVSWNTFGRKGDAGPGNKRGAERYIAKYGTEEGKEMLCINPLTFDIDKPDAAKTDNLGALPGVQIGRAHV